MGLMQGHVDGDTFVVTDAFRLPVEGTETRVNAQAEAEEYMVNYVEMGRAQGARKENIVGWYHSHPGYGCWLSGIDVGTQMLQQKFQDPFLAVVIDPERTIDAGKVEIGAFRTFPEDGVDNATAGGFGGATGKKTTMTHPYTDNDIDNDNDNSGDDLNHGGLTLVVTSGVPIGLATAAAPDASATSDDARHGHGSTGAFSPAPVGDIPNEKMLEYGAHATKYYALEVSHFKSTLDTLLLEQLWDKYWVQTLSQSPLFSNREFSTKRMRDLNNSMMNITDEMAHAHALGSHVGGNGGSGGKSASEAAVSATGGPSSMSGSRQIDVNIENLATDMHAAVMRELTGLAAFETKALLFHGGA